MANGGGGVAGKNLAAYNARNALKEVGILNIGYKQARDLLNMRSDL